MRLIPIFWTILNLVESLPSELVDPNCPWVRLNGRLRRLTTFFSDYDLSLVCISKCDEQYLQCVSTCSSTDCLVECNRSWAICGDCEYTFYWNEGSLMRIIRFNHFLACPCHTDCIDGCQGCDNPVCFCNVSRNNQYRTVNVINTYLRTTRMMITWMLVSIRPAKLSANVFWIAKMILGAKLLVCRPSKMNIPSVLARFAKLIITFSDSFS